MRIVAYKVSNFKGLKALSFKPDRHVVIVAGPNAAGKSSALDAIESTLAGASKSPGRTVHNGANEASCTLDLGGLKVTRKWHADGDSRLYLENEDGSKPRAPQTTLSAMLSNVAMDPLRFSRAEPKEQARILRKITGLEDEFKRIDGEISDIETERRDVNRALRTDEAALAGFPPEDAFQDVPDSAPDMAELMRRYQDAAREQVENDDIRSRLKADRKNLQTAESMRKASSARVARAKEELARAEEDLALWDKEVAEGEETVKETEAVASELVDPDLTAIKAEMERAESVRSKVRAKAERASVVDRIADHRAESDRLTLRIERHRQSKSDLMMRTKIPVPGLQFDGDEVLLNGVPLEQASSSERLRVGMEVAVADDPAIRVVLVRDAVLLDDEQLKEVFRWTVERDVQAWLEMVGTPDEPNVIVLKEGRLASKANGKAKKTAPTLFDSLGDDEG